MKPDQWPAQPGTYALVLELPRQAKIRVGRLGIFLFPAGRYVYVGSAFGPGGLRARLQRHSRRHKRMHWHIDYLLTRARIVQVEHDVSGERLECIWARRFEQRPDMSMIVPGFGASDCTCPTHLFYFSTTLQQHRGPVEQTLDCADSGSLYRSGNVL